MGKWADELSKEIKLNLKNTNEKDLRFFRIDELIRNINRVDEFSNKCPDCNRKKTEITSIANTIEIAVNNPGKKRREYDKFINNLSKHMQKEHGYFAPYYFSYLYSFYGTIAGVVLGFIIYIFFPQNNWASFAIGLAAGIVLGYFKGLGKDNKIRREKKIM